MSEPVVTIERTLDEIRAMHPTMVYYGAVTCWWGIETASGGPRYRARNSTLPADPRGGVLFQTEDVEGFLRAAEAAPEHYGRHGLRAFMAAFDGVVMLGTQHWCFEKWEPYNNLLDRVAAPEREAH